ncbi:aminotransferase class V-fold PLP-dependent enzyme [Thermodesulfobacteriota bacterium]
MKHHDTPADVSLYATRRGFLKASGIAAAGGLSSLMLPGGAAGSVCRSLAGAAALPEELYWKVVRAQFGLEQGLIYMNTGTEGAMPRSVVASSADCAKRFCASPTYSMGHDEDFEQVQTKNRQVVAEFLGADPGEIVLTTNTTDGVHMAINGLDFAAGDEIITTLHEFPSATSPLYILRDRRGVVVRELALPSPAAAKQDIIDLFEGAITAQTKALCFCHINYTTGLRMPVKELCALAQQRGIISIVDGAHSTGMLDYDLHDLGCDFYATAGHKWLCGPPGTGMFYVRDAANNPHGLWPVLTEAYEYLQWMSITDVLQNRGQQNTPCLVAMLDAIVFQETIGKQKIEQRVLALQAYAKEKIIAAWGEECLLTPLGDDELCSGLVAFNPVGDTGTISCGGIYTALAEEHNIYLRSVWFKDTAADADLTQGVRLSTHIYNSFDEIDEVVQKIQLVIKSR